MVETAHGVIDRGESSSWNLPIITACRELHSGRRTQVVVVSKETRQLAALTLTNDTPTVSELFATGASHQTANDTNNQTATDTSKQTAMGVKIRLLPSSVAPYRASYRLTPAEWGECKRQIKLCSDKGQIRRARSPYGAPVLFVPKLGGAPGELRMVID